MTDLAPPTTSPADCPPTDLSPDRPAAEMHEPLSAFMMAMNLVAVVAPLVGLVVAIVTLWDWGVGWVEVGMLFGLYVVTTLGITIGFHRLFTHQSFETSPAVQFVLAGLGSMAAQGPLFQWVATHRRHHQYSDRPEDPHSPHQSGGGLGGLIRGAWYSHVGWMFTPVPVDMARYVKDLRKRPGLQTAHALFPVWVLVGLIGPAVVGGLIAGTWTGAFLGFVWGGLARVCLVHHITWSVNSVCHLWGTRPYPDTDRSRNNWVFGILAMGEGWHNNHHAFPLSARHGFRWWQFDPSWVLIRGMEMTGIVWKVRRPA